jgi:RIO-like serine/threonine protein kinase
MPAYYSSIYDLDEYVLEGCTLSSAYSHLIKFMPLPQPSFRQLKRAREKAKKREHTQGP